MNPWSSLPPNMRTTARGLRVSITSRTCVNQLKTSGRSSPLAIRPSIASTASTARLPATARRSDSPGTTTSESPAIQRRSFCFGRELHALRRRCGRRHRRRRLRLRRDDGGVDLVVVRAAERGLERARGRSRRSAPLTLSSGPVTASATSRFQPSGWIVADLCRPGAFRRSATRSPASETTIADPAECRRRPPSAVRRRGRRVVSRASPSELEVDERCHALGPHRVDDEERERQHDRLRRDRKPARSAP